MYEKIVIKTEYDKRAVINVNYFSIVLRDGETYLKCVLDSATLFIPFDSVIEITYDRQKYKKPLKGEKKKNGEKTCSK